MRSLLPGCVAVSQTRTELSEELFPAEQAHLGRAVGVRRQEFATVRGCAREALATLGFERGPMVPARHGAPVWPDGIVGSMTHCVGFRAAAVAHRADVLALGIDAEPALALPPGVLEAVASAQERAHLLDLPDPAAGRVLFSAKESIYKAWYAATGTRLDFDDVDVALDGDGTFRWHFRRARTPSTPTVQVGRWRVDGGLIRTAIVLTTA